MGWIGSAIGTTGIDSILTRRPDTLLHTRGVRFSMFIQFFFFNKIFMYKEKKEKRKSSKEKILRIPKSKEK